MTLGDLNLACAWALVDELVRGGLEHACVSPGSRSTPLALAMDRHPSVTVHVHLDERSSAFFALGIAKATGRPVAVACTSGTAAAELFPAAVEASQTRTPLIMLTADRPPRLRGTGANQTIDQVGLYGRYARACLEPPAPSNAASIDAWRSVGADAARTAFHGVLPGTHAAGPPGPVHVDCPFEEPLVPSETWSPPSPPSPSTRPIRAYARPAYAFPTFTEAISGVERGVLLVGELRFPEPDILDLADRLGWPVIAEPTSNLRLDDRVLRSGQALLANERWMRMMAPEIVLQFGSTPTTRSAQRLVEGVDRLVVVAPEDALDPDPEGRATVRIDAMPPGIARELLEGLPSTEGSDEWRRVWRRADGRVRTAIDAAMDRTGDPSEPRVARDLAAAIPDGGTLVVGSSMPIRDLDLAMAPREGLRVLANRGASGIDGFVSTVLGIAASDRGATFALMGDLTFLYDVGALLWNARRDIDAVIVVLNDGGGGIFSFLPQRELPEFERLFETPHGLHLGTICAAAGAGHATVDQADQLIPAIERATAGGGLHVIEVRIDRSRDRTLRAALAAAVDASLEDPRP
jgi:2-succinyl-5-enolpyruvyl-6-hydroxy-3-cyclohexene-1-carboxylate synthase